MTAERQPHQSIEFPDGIVDATGRRLHPGARVVDSIETTAGIVTRYSPRRGVEILTDQDQIVARHPSELHRTDQPGEDELSGWFITESSQHPVCLVVPIGGRDMQTKPGSPGPFPPRSSSTQQEPVAAWSHACLEVIADLSPEDAAMVVADHLDAPMLRRLLDESTLPPTIHRLVPIITSQTPPHPGDTAALMPLIEAWMEATQSNRHRVVSELAGPVVIESRPDVVEGMYHNLRRELAPHWADCDMVAVAQAGGTPAMAFAATLAATRSGRRVIHIQTLKGGPTVEMALDPSDTPRVDPQLG